MDLLILLGLNGILWYENPSRLSPDGFYYLNRPFLRPYVMRFPFVWAASRFKWEWISKGSILLTSLILWWGWGIVAAVLWLGLASTKTNTIFPILTDQAGILFFTAVILLPSPWNILFGLGSGLISEKGPLFASLFLWNPLPLIGLAAPLLCWWKMGENPLESDPIWLRKSCGEARKVFRLDPQTLILPWGVALIGLPLTPISCVLLAYSQLLIAQDRARLFQWIGPLVCIYAAPLLPPTFLLPILAIHFLNPWRGVI